MATFVTKPGEGLIKVTSGGRTQCAYQGRLVKCPSNMREGVNMLPTGTRLTEIDWASGKAITTATAPLTPNVNQPQSTAVAVKSTPSGSPTFTPQNPIATPPQTTPLVAMDDPSAINQSMLLAPAGDIFGVPRNTALAIGVGGIALFVLALVLRRK